MRKKLLSIVLCTALVASLAGCSKSSATDATTAAAGNGTAATTAASGTESTTPSEYRMLYSSEVSTLNYLVTSTINEMKVAANTIDTLVEFDSDGVLKEGLATAWSYDEATRTWTFTLRSDAKWVDNTGKEVANVTANDFVSALKYVLTPEYEAANAQNTFGIIENAEEYYNGLVYQGKADDSGKTWAEISFDEVGVKAVNDTTLTYTLANDVPYFLSSLVYVLYMPAYGPQLEELGASFGTAADKMYYNGAYYLESFEPQVSKVMKKNALNYDAANVFIDKIVYTYNAEANTIGPEMVKRDEVDYAVIGSDILDEWMSSPATSSLVSKERPDTSYSYFYCFNFDPHFDAAYEPENWKLAANNENFRQSMMAAVNRLATVSISEQTNPQDYIMNTITPSSFTATAAGVDYTKIGDLGTITEFYNKDAALAFKDKAVAELTAAGATFPIKVLVKYNPSTTDWDNECTVLEQQVESVLGTDYVDIIVEAGPSDSFLTQVRRSGDYAFMKCGWGADYADPETWTDPFYQAEGSLGYKYAFMRTAIDENTAAAATVAKYFELVEAAKDITVDTEARYKAFADAEAYLINHALVIPYGITVSAYISTKVNVFDGQNAPFGVSMYRFKGQKVLDHFVSMEEYSANAK